ncbi:MAG: SpoIVB peptidase S55 domain-containing protein [Clostridiales bacterium]|nr:SpoIVB peptidase S55 domain-containing protein [Clostridiales bacterium]
MKHGIKFISFSIIFNFLLFNTCFAYAKYVYPSGETIGVKLYTDGLLVVGVSDAANGVKKGDIIESANGKLLKSSSELSEIAGKGGSVMLSIKRGDEKLSLTLEPTNTEYGPRLGLWLRDSTAGIGTLTYYDPENSSFGALGHGITDIDTGQLMRPKSGVIGECSVSSIIKSSAGSIGEIKCSFGSGEYGSLLMNTSCGIYGKLSGDIRFFEKAQALQGPEPGDAYILTDIDGNGAKPYSAKVLKVYDDRQASKSIVLEVTDDKLISKTGGIVQGMSGAPIMQDGNFVGALTHVFVNDPKKGYGIKAGKMLEFSASLN